MLIGQLVNTEKHFGAYLSSPVFWQLWKQAQRGGASSPSKLGTAQDGNQVFQCLGKEVFPWGWGPLSRQREMQSYESRMEKVPPVFHAPLWHEMSNSSCLSLSFSSVNWGGWMSRLCSSFLSSRSRLSYHLQVPSQLLIAIMNILHGHSPLWFTNISVKLRGAVASVMPSHK